MGKRLVLFGEFQIGKSTLFDYLCGGRELSEVGDGLSTTHSYICATPLPDSEQDEFAYVQLNKKVQKCSFAELQTSGTHGYGALHYYLQSPVLKYLGYTVADCPGTENADGREDEELLLMCVKNTDLLVYLCSKGEELNTRTRRLLVKLGKQRKKVVFVLNCIGKARRDVSNVVRTVEAQIEDSLEQEVKLHVIHARMALHAVQMQTLQQLQCLPYDHPYSAAAQSKKLPMERERLKEAIQRDWSIFTSEDTPPHLEEVLRVSGVPSLIEHVRNL